METKGGAIQQQLLSSGGEGPRRHHHQTDIIDADATDSDSMSHQERLLGQTATSSIQGFQQFTGSLFDSPPSMLSSANHVVK
ncbi:hypothetical protein GCK72_007742 [Caenorhabditis remanei]|uniref:Uncharacterized protein n=1 Tax=Caenorhabditis remanei TaxID=31234 RepID=A0A6A5HN47_CAERE|nr:hypothetical protein GCK72_007742 [Caenorhabditis remanei]KAF1767783.1 hypothetical protein GCK72_007742 [Caenorhabditis remanei]